MSANIVNVVHKEGRQEGRQPALRAIHYASFCAACGMQHACSATCHRAAAAAASKKLSQLIRQQRAENRARAPKQQPPLCGALLLASAASALAASK